MSEHDLATMKVMDKLTDKPPRKQAQAMMNLRTELNVLTREMAELKSSYDIYQASIMEQAMLIKNLASFGVKAPNFPGFGGQNDPNKLPSEFPRVGRGSRANSSSFDFIKEFLETTKAWAAASKDLGVFANEFEWLKAWNQHTQDYEKYVESVNGREKLAVREAAKIISNRYDSVSLENPETDDIDTMATMYDFSESVSVEAKNLLENATSGKISLNGNQLSLLRKIEQESSETIESLESAFLSTKDTFSKSPEENPTPYLELMFSYLAE